MVRAYCCVNKHRSREADVPHGFFAPVFTSNASLAFVPEGRIPEHNYQMVGELLDSSPAKKVLHFPGRQKALPVSAVCACSPKANSILDCNKRVVGSRAREVIILLFSSLPS